MRIVTGIMLVSAAALLSGCVGGIVVPGWSDDKITVDVDGINPMQMQQMADTTCRERDFDGAKLLTTNTDGRGVRHDHFECKHK